MNLPHTDCTCFWCEDVRHRDRHPESVDGCRSCKLQSLQIGVKVGQDTRGRKIAPLGAKGGNEWERGIVKDARGVPIIVDGEPIGVKQYAERRRELEERRRLLHNPQE